MKVLNTTYKGDGSFHAIQNSFLDYLPAGMTETFDFNEADILFSMTYGMNRPEFFLSEEHFFVNKLPLPEVVNLSHHRILAEGYLDIGSIFTVSELAKSFLGKPIVMYFDTFGEVYNTSYPDFLKDEDFPVSTVSLPAHPHSRVVQLIDENRFYLESRYDREEGSIIMMADQASVVLSDLQMLLKDKSVTRLYVAGSGALGVCEQLKSKKVLPVETSWPDGIRRYLNRVEYVLSVIDDAGLELLGPEGGFCGAQPIYPDTPYYREHFQDDDFGVKYWSAGSFVSDVLEVVSQPNMWVSESRDAFVTKFSAKNSIPSFWEYVKSEIED